MAVRKQVLLRFRPDLLERVDEQAGVVDRHTFLMTLIENGLDDLDMAAGGTPSRRAVPYADTNFYQHQISEIGAHGRN